jgi:hypothetical protein
MVHNIPITFQSKKILVNAVVHYEHLKVIRCDIKPGSVERSRDVENEKNPKDKCTLRYHFQAPVSCLAFF